MRRLVALLIAVLAFPLAARADDASKRAKIDELFTVMHLDRTMQQVMDAMEKSVIPMTQQLVGGDVPEPLKKQVSEMQRQMFELIEQQMSWKEMEPAYVEIYARNFTEEQIDDIVAFYKTPTGAALLDKLPTLTSEGMQAAQARMITLQPQIRKMLEDFANQNAEAIKRARAMRKSGT